MEMTPVAVWVAQIDGRFKTRCLIFHTIRPIILSGFRAPRHEK
jgi:hypothetical protein